MPAARHSRFCSCAAACLLAAVSMSARANASQATSLTFYEHAEELRQGLEAQPETQRSRRDYERVLDAYRAVYHSDPGSAKADASVSAVADLLSEEGRVFTSPKAFRDAIGQYEFLRRQYPYSRYRYAALIAEGEIYRTGLADRDQAKAEFEEFLKTYPRNPLAEQARAGLAEIRNEEALNGPAGRRTEQARSVDGQEQEPTAKPAEAAPTRASTRAARQSPPVADGSQAITPAAAAPDTLSASEENSPLAAVDASDATEESPEAAGRPAKVTGIRYWLSPSDTRIAIDLEDQVKYGAARIPRPNRIYFDLRGTRLAPSLKERSIAVGDDAMLTRIRAAQYSNDVTRIVLDVGAGVDYSAFFLPNPWRLIIDIHNHRTDGAPAPMMDAANRKPAPPIQNSPIQTPSIQTSAIQTAAVQAPPAPSATQTSRKLVEPAPEAVPRSTSSRNSRSRSRNELEVLAPLPVTARTGVSSPDSTMAGSSTLDSADAGASSLDSPASGDLDASTPYGDEFPSGREAGPTADGERSMARTLGLKVGRIVIDAGHGGHDCGTLGPGGIEEKDVTLDVALRLGRLLKDRLGAEVVYTRRDDTFIPLQTRTAIANEAHADLFISIHANSSPDPTARGVESYYLNFTTAPDALEVAARENAVSNESVSNLSDLVKEIALKDKIEESREFAVDVQRSLYNGLEAGNPGLKNRGVKKAPFVVLIGANMPSILAEVSFLTNPDDARELRQAAYRERIAESLYHGVARYINGLNGVRLAENGTRPGN